MARQAHRIVLAAALGIILSIVVASVVASARVQTPEEHELQRKAIVMGDLTWWFARWASDGSNFLIYINFEINNNNDFPVTIEKIDCEFYKKDQAGYTRVVARGHLYPDDFNVKAHQRIYVKRKMGPNGEYPEGELEHDGGHVYPAAQTQLIDSGSCWVDNFSIPF
jgi:hypothetical protein